MPAGIVWGSGERFRAGGSGRRLVVKVEKLDSMTIL